MKKSPLVKIGVVVVPIILFLGLLYNYLGLSGVKTVRYVVGDSSPFIQSLLPSERVGKVENGSVKLLDEPVYFSVFAPPGGWETADVKLSFNTGSHAILELGVLKDLFAQAFDFRPFANTVVENLEANGWTGRPVAKLGANINAFVRQEFVGADPSAIKDSEIGVYRAALPWAPPRGATSSKREHTFSLSLQGPHELFTAIGDGETLKITINASDLNQVVGADEGAIRVYTKNGEMVAEQGFADDGNATADGLMGSLQSVTIAPDGLPAGVYRIVLSGTSDVVFSTFTTKQNYLVVKNSITLAAHVGPVALNTNAKKIAVEPLTADALGSAIFGATPITLDTVRAKRTGITAVRDISAIILPGGSVKVTGEGFFALADALFFAPEPAGFTNFTAAPEAFKALIAYFPPQMKEGDWRVATSTFDLRTLAKERGAYKFVLSAPLVKEKDGGVNIHAIDITFKKPPLTFRSLASSLKAFVKDLIW
ncbi:MAG: hypothetical protein WC813_02945 [Patescibacteria group bacterium]|jgi:hypothetical protein